MHPHLDVPQVRARADSISRPAPSLVNVDDEAHAGVDGDQGGGKEGDVGRHHEQQHQPHVDLRGRSGAVRTEARGCISATA